MMPTVGWQKVLQAWSMYPLMVAEHEMPLLASAYPMGIRDYDTKNMFEAVYKIQTTPDAC